MHIEKKEMQQLHKKNIEEVERIKLLEHISHCDYCANLWMEVEMEEDGLQAPSYLKSQMMQRVQMLDVKTEVKIKTTSKQVQLLLYGLKTTAAVLGALLILLSVGQISVMKHVGVNEQTRVTEGVSNTLSEKSNSIADMLQQYSNQIIDGGIER
jgi:hypothetical protein